MQVTTGARNQNSIVSSNFLQQFTRTKLGIKAIVQIRWFGSYRCNNKIYRLADRDFLDTIILYILYDCIIYSTGCLRATTCCRGTQAKS